MKFDFQLFLYILLRITISGVSSVHWSTKYANDLQARGIAMCKSLSGLTKTQLDLCYKHPEVTSVALRGLRLAVEECQHQFHKNRWNCSSLITKNSNPHTSSLLKKGYKEASFSYAIIAAGVAHSVATACSQGSLLECACDPRPSKYDILAARHNNNAANNSPHPHKKPHKKHQKWKWAGCSHNLDFGIQFSKRFLDSREQNGVDLQSQVNLHNNRVGRLMLKELMVEKCKCHGMSGSCEIRTCWHSAPSFRTVGEALKKKFSHAIRVDQSNLGNGMPLILPEYRRRYDNTLRNQRPRPGRGNSNRMKRGGPRKHLNKMKTELIYYQKSPNYCEKDNDVDFPGTAGRYCNKTSVFAVDNCESLCCGRGYNLRREVKNLKCKCKFKWCCTVECETCRVEEWNAVCK